MPSPASCPTRWHRTIAKRLVSDHGLRRHGLSASQLDLILLDEKTREDFLSSYATLSELGPDVFWQLIAEYDEEQASAEQTQSASATPVDPAATSITGTTSLERRTGPVTEQAHKDNSRTPNHGRLESQPRPRGLKRTQSLAARQTVEADERLQALAVEHGSKNKKAKTSTTANASSGRPSRQCSGWSELNGERVPCERMFKNHGSWVKHWNKCHDGLPMAKPQFEYLTIVPHDPAPPPRGLAQTQAANNLDIPGEKDTHTELQNGTAASLHQYNRNQPQPGPVLLDIATCDNNLEAGVDGQNNVNGSDIATNIKTEGHTPDASFSPAIAAPSASMASQAPNIDAPNPVDSNFDYGFGLISPPKSNVNPNAVLDFDSFDQIFYANESVGWDDNHLAGPSTGV